jgi:hypothetical protein
MHDTRRRKRISLQQPVHAIPGHTSTLRAAIEPLLPYSVYLVEEVAESFTVSGDPVILVMPSQLLSQGLLLPSDLVVTMRLAPFRDPRESSSESVLGRFALHDPLSGERPSPEVREAQQVERPWSARLAFGREPIWTTKIDKPRLVGGAGLGRTCRIVSAELP